MNQPVCESETMPGRRANFTTFYRVLPPWFVDKAVEAIKQMRCEVTERTWFDNYVARLWDVLDIVAEHSASGAIKWPSSSSVEYDAVTMSGLFYESTENPHLAKKTRSKIRNCINKVCRVLVRAGVLPHAFTIRGTPNPRRAETGKSLWTVPGSRRVEPEPPPISVFVVISEKHGRNFDYRRFEKLGPMFLRHVAVGLDKIFDRLSASEAKNQHEVFLDFLNFLMDRKQENSRTGFFRTLGTNAYWALDESDWEIEVGIWRELQRKSTSTGVQHNIQTGSTRAQMLGKVFAALADQSILPAVRVNGFRKAKARASVNRRTRRVLAQLPVKQDCVQPQDMPEALVVSLSRYFQDQSLFDEAREFLTALYMELGPEVLEKLSPEQAATMMFDLNAERLKALRAYFEDVFVTWSQHWEAGQAAVRNADKSGAEIIELVDSDRYTESERKANSRTVFGGEHDATHLGNILQYVLARYNGQVSDVHGRIHHLSRKLGGKARLNAYLHPHPEATIALWGLIMIDTFANCEVAREMPWGCLHESTEPGYTKVDLGIKGRADYKRILDELPTQRLDVRLVVPQAIVSYKRMAELLHSMAAEGKGADKLMLYEYAGRVGVLPESTARNRMTMLLNSNPTIAGWGLLPSMIRPSALMSEEHSDEVHMPVAQAFADHENRNTTNRSYTGQTPARIRALVTIRDFQGQYQAVTILCDKVSAQLLGLSVEEVEYLLSDAARTGMGVACINAKAGVQPGTRRGEDCHRKDKCSDCSQRYIVATEDNFADLILLSAYVKRVLLKAENDRVEPREVIVRLKYFTDAVIAKASQTSAAAVLERGRTLANTRQDDYFEAFFGEN